MSDRRANVIYVTGIILAISISAISWGIESNRRHNAEQVGKAVDAYVACVQTRRDIECRILVYETLLGQPYWVLDELRARIATFRLENGR